MWFNYLILLTIVRVCKGTVSSSESFGWLWKEPVCYSRYSKWCPFAFTHARSRTRHWSIASSTTSWDRLDRCRWDAVLAGWRLSTVPVSLSFWNNLLMLRFVHPLSGNSASNLLALNPYDRCKLLINIFSSSLNVIVYKYCSDVWMM